MKCDCQSGIYAFAAGAVCVLVWVLVWVFI